MKNLKKGTVLIIIAIIAFVLMVAGFVILKNIQVQSEQIVGNNRDGHGCIGSTGYTWCEAKQKCLRIWEEECKAGDMNTGDFVVILPNGGEKLVSGQSYEINWTPAGSGFVNIFLLGENCQLEPCPGPPLPGTKISGNIKDREPYIVKNIPNTGKYEWKVGQYFIADNEFNAPRGKNYRISITFNQSTDISNEVFSISPIYLLAPNGGEKWKKGSRQKITWSPVNDTINIFLFPIPPEPEPCNKSYCPPPAEFPKYPQIEIIRNTDGNSGLYSWVVTPSSIGNDEYYGNYKITICTALTTGGCYTSDSSFVIKQY